MPERETRSVRVDPVVWSGFVEQVIEWEGQKHGELGRHVENALREYVNNDRLTRLEAKVENIEAAVGAAPSDGGVDTISPDSHTHAPTEKPAANASTGEKVDYLAERLLDEVVGGNPPIEAVPRDVVRAVIEDEYGFRGDTTTRYVSRLVDHFDLHENPLNDDLFVCTERYQELYEEHNA